MRLLELLKLWYYVITGRYCSFAFKKNPQVEFKVVILLFDVLTQEL